MSDLEYLRMERRPVARMCSSGHPVQFRTTGLHERRLRDG